MAVSINGKPITQRGDNVSINRKPVSLPKFSFTKFFADVLQSSPLGNIPDRIGTGIAKHVGRTSDKIQKKGITRSLADVPKSIAKGTANLVFDVSTGAAETFPKLAKRVFPKESNAGQFLQKMDDDFDTFQKFVKDQPLMKQDPNQPLAGLSGFVGEFGPYGLIENMFLRSIKPVTKFGTFLTSIGSDAVITAPRAGANPDESLPMQFAVGVAGGLLTGAAKPISREFAERGADVALGGRNIAADVADDYLESQGIISGRRAAQLGGGEFPKDLDPLSGKPRRFKDVNELLEEVNRSKIGKQGLDVSGAEAKQINDLFLKSTDEFNLKYRGNIVENKFIGLKGEDLFLGAVKNEAGVPTFVVAELDNGKFNGRIRTHSTSFGLAEKIESGRKIGDTKQLTDIFNRKGTARGLEIKEGRIATEQGLKEAQEEALRGAKVEAKEFVKDISPERSEAVESLSGFIKRNELGLRSVFGLKKSGKGVLTDFLEKTDLPSLSKIIKNTKESKTKSNLLREISFLKANVDEFSDEAFREAVSLRRETSQPKVVADQGKQSISQSDQLVSKAKPRQESKPTAEVKKVSSNKSIARKSKEGKSISPAVIKRQAEKRGIDISRTEMVEIEKEFVKQSLGTVRGSMSNFIKRMKNTHGVSDEVISATEFRGVPIEDIVKVKREKNGLVSTMITKPQLKKIVADFKGKMPKKEWINKNSWKGRSIRAARASGDIVRGFEVPQVMFDRLGLSDEIYRPIRWNGERVAMDMKTKFHEKIEPVTTLSKKESEIMWEHMAARQGKKVRPRPLTPKIEKAIKAFDDVVDITSPDFYRVADKMGLDVGRVDDYAPLYTSDDLLILEDVTPNLDFVVRKHPAFGSLKARVENVPLSFYEKDYRKVAQKFVEKVSDFITIGDQVVDVKYLVDSDEFLNIVGRRNQGSIQDWIKNVTTGSIAQTDLGKTIEAGSRALRKGVGRSILGASITSALKQPLSLVNTLIVEGRLPRFKKGIDLKTASLAERRGQIAIADMNGKIDKTLFWGLQNIDKVSARAELGSAWNAQLKKLGRTSDELTDIERTYMMNIVQDQVDLMFGGMTSAQIPPIMRSEIGKLFTSFISPLNSQLNFYFKKIANEQGIKKVKMGARVASAMVTIAYLEQAITKMSFNWTDEEGMKDDVLHSLAGNVPMLGSLVYAISTGQAYQPIAAISHVSNFFVTASKWDEGNKTDQDMAFAFAELMGFPQQIERTYTGTQSALEGVVKTKSGKVIARIDGIPENIRAVLRGNYNVKSVREHFRKKDLRTERNKDIKALVNKGNLIEALTMEDELVKKGALTDKSNPVREQLRFNFGITGTIHSDENIDRIMEMPGEERLALIDSFSEKTQKSIKKEISKRERIASRKKGTSSVSGEISRIKKKTGEELINAIKNLKKSFSNEELLDLFGEKWILDNL